jgi:holo-[acyl-carrier protein] synthase
VIVGVGIDLVEPERIGAALARHPGRAHARFFTEAERRYCDGCANPSVHYAARFAAKEAFSKALRQGIRTGLRWIDIEVVRNPDGAPALRLHGQAADILRLAGAARVHLSLSHTAQHATAVVILEA